MKVYILSMQQVNNYGSVLQPYLLCIISFTARLNYAVFYCQHILFRFPFAGRITIV